MAAKKSKGPKQPSALVAAIGDEMARRGLSEYMLAKLAGIPAGTLNRLLSGERPDPRLSTLMKLAAALDLRVILSR